MVSTGSAASTGEPRSLDPTDEEMASWTAIADASVWCGYNSIDTGSAADIPTSMSTLGSYMDLIRLELTKPIEALADMDPGELDEEIATWRFQDESRPSIACRTRARNMARVCRIAVGFEQRSAETRQQAIAGQAHDRETARIAATAALQQATNVATADARVKRRRRKIKISDIADASLTD